MTTQDIILGERGAGKTKKLFEEMTPEQRIEYANAYRNQIRRLKWHQNMDSCW